MSRSGVTETEGLGYDSQSGRYDFPGGSGKIHWAMRKIGLVRVQLEKMGSSRVE